MIHKKLRALVLALAVVAAMGALWQGAVAQTTDKEDEGKLILKIGRLPDARSTAPADLASMAVVEAFHKDHPHIRLRSFTGLSIGGMQMDTQVLMAIAGGVPPDVLTVNFRQSDSYISQNFLYPLDEFIGTKELGERVPAPVVPVAHRKGPDGEVHWYALPHQFGVRALTWRKDLFMEVGLDPNKPPKTWDELEAYAERLTRPEKGTSGLMLTTGGDYMSWDWVTFLWSAGGEAMVQDEKTGEWRAAFDSDEAVEAMLFYVKLNCQEWPDSTGKIQRGYVCRDSTGAYYSWLSGKVGMAWANLDESSLTTEGVDPDLLGLAPVPSGPTGLRGNELNAGMMGIFSDIQPRNGYSVEQVRQAAFDFIWFYGSDEANAIRTRVLVENGNGKFVNPLWLKKFGYEEYLKLVPETWIQVFEDAVKHGKPEPYGKNCQMVYSYMSKPIEECIDLELKGQLGKTDAEKRAKIKAILTKAVERTNEEMIGLITPAERQKRNNVALVVAICMFTGFFFVLRKVWLIFTPKEEMGIPQKGSWQFWRFRWAYIILIPAVGSVLLWNYYPMFRGTIMAFQDYRVVGESKFSGLQNLGDVLWDPVWWQSLVKTLYYMALILGLGFWTPIVLAILLSEVSHGKVLYRTLYYLPAVLTSMVVIYLWMLFYDPTDTGILNMLLAKIGIPAHRWLQDSRWAMIACVIPTVWAGMGPGCLLYLAALKAVPEDLYEAADLDGCGFWKKTVNITLPTLKGLIIINFIGAFIGASQSSGMILVLTFGRAGTNVAGLHIFNQAYLMLRFGPAITMAWILGVVMLGFTVLQLKRLSRMEFVTADSQKKL